MTSSAVLIVLSGPSPILSPGIVIAVTAVAAAGYDAVRPDNVDTVPGIFPIATSVAASE